VQQKKNASVALGVDEAGAMCRRKSRENALAKGATPH
jgi:hypothetical protein